MKKYSWRIIAIFWVFILLQGCNSLKKLGAKRTVTKSLHSEVFTNQFTGFVLYDPQTNQYLFDHHGDLYFTPASNTKILTALACFETFRDSLPSFLSHISADTLLLEPMGDPTLLHPDFPDQPVFDLLKKHPVQLHYPEDPLFAFGAGWMWDDYESSFQPQRSWMPLYGNQVRIFNKDSLRVVPEFFRNYVNLYVGEKPGNLIYRELKYNLFNVWMENDTSSFERQIPFDYSIELAHQLLQDTLQKRVELVNIRSHKLYDTLYNQATLPVLSLMMQRSDNFLAEQLLILAAKNSGYRNLDDYRNMLLESWGFPGEVQWVDGSGLSRYNLITPRTLVKALHRLYRIQEWTTIQQVFPTGGLSGTIKNWYNGSPAYIFAKTGTLRNNHSLSGFIKTHSGKILIFSFMNNHYTKPTSVVKLEMQHLLETIRDRY